MPEAVATYKGQRPDQGRLIIGNQYPNEGYAVMRCGGTEVQIGYTLLHHLRIQIDGAPTEPVAQLAALQRAFDAITCEASLGRTG